MRTLLSEYNQLPVPMWHNAKGKCKSHINENFRLLRHKLISNLNQISVFFGASLSSLFLVYKRKFWVYKRLNFVFLVPVDEQLEVRV